MWCNHTCAVILSYEVYDSPRSSLEREWISMRTSRDTWCNHMCAMTLSFVCSDAFICAHWLVYSSDVTFWCEPTWISIWTCDTWLTHFMFKLRWSEMVLSLDMKNGLGRRFLEFVVFNVSFEHETCDSLDNVDQEYHIMHQMRLLRQCWPRISHNASGSRGRLQHYISGLVETCRPTPLRSIITSASVRSITTNECRLASITRAFKVATDSDQTVTPEKKHLIFLYYAVHYNNKSLTLLECALNPQKVSMKLLLFLDYALAPQGHIQQMLHLPWLGCICDVYPWVWMARSRSHFLCPSLKPTNLCCAYQIHHVLVLQQIMSILTWIKSQNITFLMRKMSSYRVVPAHRYWHTENVG